MWYNNSSNVHIARHITQTLKVKSKYRDADACESKRNNVSM